MQDFAAENAQISQNFDNSPAPARSKIGLRMNLPAKAGLGYSARGWGVAVAFRSGGFHGITGPRRYVFCGLQCQVSSPRRTQFLGPDCVRDFWPGVVRHSCLLLQRFRLPLRRRRAHRLWRTRATGAGGSVSRLSCALSGRRNFHTFRRATMTRVFIHASEL